MAGSRIKGICVEIDGNVTGLEKALKSVNSTVSASANHGQYGSPYLSTMSGASKILLKGGT